MWTLLECDWRRGDGVRDHATGLYDVYTVRETISVRWNDPDDVRYLHPSTEPILTRITCEGAFDADASNYSNRRIAIAELTGQAPYRAPSS